MKQSIQYLRAGEYYVPNLKIQEEQGEELQGKYARMRRTYLKENQAGQYTALLMTGQLTKHLSEIDKTTRKQVEKTLRQLLRKAPPPNKDLNPLGWTRHMEMLRRQAEELVYPETIYL